MRIFTLQWKSWLSLLKGKGQNRLAVRQSARPWVEPLEDRWVPSGTPTVDLTSAGSLGAINGAIFRQADQQPSGSGVIDSFVRLKAPGHSTIEQGYNTDARPLQFDENKSPVFTRSLQLSSIPVVNIGGTNYREFLLDINQNHASPLLSLDELRFFTGSTGSLNNYDTGTNTLNGQPASYDMGAGNWVELNASLSHGSGSSDMYLYVPAADFTGGPYVYLYSKFGANVGANGGYEEWAVGAGAKAVTADNTASLSGQVLNGASNTGLANVPVTLTLNIQGNPVSFTTTTALDGSYAFSNLISGTYSDSAGLAPNFVYKSASAGTVSGVPDGTVVGTHSITQISLNSSDAGVQYNFVELRVQQTYSISGLLTQIPGTPAALITLTDNTTGATTTLSVISGSYSFTGLTAGDSYTVSAVAAPPFVVEVTPTAKASYTVTDLSGDVINDNFFTTRPFG